MITLNPMTVSNAVELLQKPRFADQQCIEARDILRMMHDLKIEPNSLEMVGLTCEECDGSGACGCGRICCKCDGAGEVFRHLETGGMDANEVEAMHSRWLARKAAKDARDGKGMAA